MAAVDAETTDVIKASLSPHQPNRAGKVAKRWSVPYIRPLQFLTVKAVLS